MKRCLSILAPVLFVCVQATTPLHGQEFRATITGRVADLSGSVVPNVNIQATNVATNEVRSASSGSVGDYTIPFLAPGSYTLSAEAAGFKKFIREKVTLDVGQTLTVDVVLELGTVTEEIRVTGEAPLIDTVNADRGQVIDQQLVAELPLNGRTPIMLSQFTAGVNYTGTVIYQRPFDNSAIDSWSINGSGQHQSDFVLDGAPNNGGGGNNYIALVPPVDAVEEFKIQTNSFDAQYGKTGGGIINMSLKSGTNALHGTIYEFARRTGFDTNSFQNNAIGQPTTTHLQDQYGGELAGPVYVPKIYNGRDRTFFMVAFERYREIEPNPFTLSVPTAEMRTGDFSRLVQATGQPVTIYDPTTGSSVNGQWVRNPFPGNVIPTSRISPIASKVLNYLPLPNVVTPGVAYAQQNYFLGGSNPISWSVDGFWNLAFKIDQNLGSKNHLFYRNATNRRFENRDTNGIGCTPGEAGYCPHRRLNNADVLDWVDVVSPHLVIDVRGSFNRYTQTDDTQGNANFDITTLGFPASLQPMLPYGPRFPSFSFTNYDNLSSYPDSTPSVTLSLQPSVTKIWRSHTIKAGADMRWVQYSTQTPGTTLSFAATANFTQAIYNQTSASSGDAIATFLLGTPSSGSTVYQPYPIYLEPYYAPYIQDDWKVTRRLTVNLGLRWDFEVPPNERYNRLNRGFDTTAVNPVDALINHANFPNLPQLMGGLLFTGTNGQPDRATNLDRSGIQPRFGLAYRVTDKFVVRGGWGRYYVNPDNNWMQNYGYSLTTPMITSLDSNQTELPNVLSNPFPTGIQQPPGNSGGLLTYAGKSFSVVNPDFSIPHVDQFSFGVQYQVQKRSKLEISYVGSRGNDLEDSKNINAMSVANRKQCDWMEGGNSSYCDALVPNPFYQVAPFAGTSFYTSPTISRSQLMLPYPEFGSITQVDRNDGASWYNSMQVVFETRLSVLSIIGNYTLSKNIVRSGFTDPANSVMQQGLFSNDIPHHVTVAAIYEFPFGPGRRLLSGGSGIVKRLVGGWQASVLFNYSSGIPWTLPGGVEYLKEGKGSNINWKSANVQGVAPCVEVWNNTGAITMQAFSVAARCTEANFLVLPEYAPGMTPTYDGRLRLRSRPNADFSLTKMTTITERMKVQFRAEAFNVTNSFNFWNLPFNNNPQSSSFGTLQPASASYAQGNYPRQIQLGVKVVF
jgi:hypothetical protein